MKRYFWIANFLAVLSSGVYGSLTDGLVAYYPFNGNANDESGNGNDGTVNGATLTMDRFGNTGQAYEFDGASYIRVPNSPSLDFSDTSERYSISLWVKWDTTANSGDVISKWNGSPGTPYPYSLQTLFDSTYVTVIAGRYTGNDVDTARFDNPQPTAFSSKYNHLAAVYTPSQIELYLNGILVDVEINTLANSFVGNALDVFIGDRGSTLDRFFLGDLDDIRIYNRALSSNEVSALYALEAGTTPSVYGSVAYAGGQSGDVHVLLEADTLAYGPTNGLLALYTFDGDASDQSGNGRDMTVLGASLAEDRFGIAQSAYYFDGSDDYMQYAGGILMANPFSCSLWFRPATSTLLSPQVLACQGDAPGGSGFSSAFNLLNDGRASFLSDDDFVGSQNIYSSSLTPMDTNAWYHLTISSDASGNRTMYVNGVSDGTANGQSFGQILSHSYLGRRGGLPQNYFHGWMDEVAYYDRALSAEEVASIYGQSYQQMVTLPAPGSYAFTNISTDIGYNLSSFMDTNGNDIWDAWEPIAAYIFNPFTVGANEAKLIDLQLVDPDNDNDGLAGYLELFTYGTSDDNTDSDGDGFDDGFEVASSYLNATNSNQELVDYIRNNPSSFELYTESSIQDLSMGGLMVEQDAGNVQLEWTIETWDGQSTNGWQVYEQIIRSISMPGDKYFMRVRAGASGP